MKRTLLGFVLLLLIDTCVIAQKIQLENSVSDVITRSTPEAMQFQKFGDLPVNTNVGTVDFSIPFFNVSIKNVNWNVGIGYNASGIKVSEVSGCVGLGWILNGLGMISSRTFQQSDVFQDNSGDDPNYKRSYDLRHVNDPQVNNTPMPLNPTDIGVANLIDYYKSLDPMDNGRAGLNFLPDIFYLNAGNLNAKFFLKGTDGYCLPAKDFEIKFVVDTINNSQHLYKRYFIITDENGTKFTFEMGGLSTTLSQWPNGGENEGPISYIAPNQWLNPVFVLSKIENTYGEIIKFNYVKQTYRYRLNDQFVYYEREMNPQNPASMGVNGFAPAEHKAIYSELQESLLESIVTSNGEKVIFEYSPRNDLIGAKKLDKVTQYYNNNGIYNFIKSFKLNNDYFGTGNSPRDLRLKLSSITQFDINNNPLGYYNFTYNSLNLPSRISAAQDSSGYYNGQDNNQNLVPYFGGNRSKSEIHIKACILEKIKYPTGGTSKIDYELKGIGGLRVKKITTNESEISKKIVKEYFYELPYYNGGGTNFSKTLVNSILDCHQHNNGFKKLWESSYVAHYSEPISNLLESYYGESTECYHKVTEILTSTAENNGKTEFYYGQPNLQTRVGLLGAENLFTKKIIFKNNSTNYKKVFEENRAYSLIDENETSTTFFNNSNNTRDVKTWGLDFDKERQEMLTMVDDCSPPLQPGQAGIAGNLTYPVRYLQYSIRLISSPILLKEESQKLYRDDGSFIETKKEYEYREQNTLNPTSIKEINSKGQPIVNKTFYPNDFFALTGNSSLTKAIKKLQNLKVKNIPIEQSKYKIENGNINKLISSQIIYTDEITTNPISFKVIENSELINDFQPLKILSGELIPDLRYMDQILYNKYDIKGNLLEQQKTNDIPECYFWGYNNQYPVAKVIGKTYNEMLSLSGIDTSILNNPNTTDVNMRIELAKPRNITGALVTSYTYKPLVGITSETDPQGKTVYYEYDSFNRLKLIRDKDNNILKTFDYKYQQQQN